MPYRLGKRVADGLGNGGTGRGPRSGRLSPLAVPARATTGEPDADAAVPRAALPGPRHRGPRRGSAFRGGPGRAGRPGRLPKLLPGDRITVRQALSHRSGLYDYTADTSNRGKVSDALGGALVSAFYGKAGKAAKGW